MKMVTTFNTKDLVSFGNYLVSEERKLLIQGAIDDGHYSGSIEDHLGVSDADLSNWKDKQSKTTKVRAKFECTFINGSDEVNETSTLNFSACIDGSPENKEFSKYTPGGSVQIAMDNNSEALKYFEEGREYYLDFTRVQARKFAGGK